MLWLTVRGGRYHRVVWAAGRVGLGDVVPSVKRPGLPQGGSEHPEGAFDLLFATIVANPSRAALTADRR